MRITTAILVVWMLGLSAAMAQEGARSTAAAPAATVNVNTASVAQLETLPGVGKATAERIVEYRQKNGNFKKVEESPELLGAACFS